jgi:hypothetical protein
MDLTKQFVVTADPYYHRGEIKNRDLVKLIKDNPKMSAESLEGIVRSALSILGFDIRKPFKTYLSPSNGTTVYEQKRKAVLKEEENE